MNYVVDRISDSGAPLISLDEAKEYLKITHDLDNRTITNLIERIINDMEGYMWISLQASTYKVYTDAAFFRNGCIPIRRGPAATITSVEYYDETNTLQTLGASNYFVSRGVPDVILREYNVTWPTIYSRRDAVVVTYTTNPTVESKVKERALIALAYLYEHRSEVDISMTELYGALTVGARKNYNF